MITIDIPTWLQIATLVLAVVYAVPKALRAVVVVTEVVRNLNPQVSASRSCGW